MPMKVITAWLEYNKELIKSPYKLMPHEYMFLISNSFDRLKLFKKNIPTDFSLQKNPIGIYSLDTTIEVHPNIDLRLESTVQNAGKITFDFDKALLFPPPPPSKAPTKKARQYTENETVRKFKELLKDPELFFQVKATISNSRVLMNKCQNNNSQFSYIRYRKNKGIMGSLESSNINLRTATMSRNHSSAVKGEVFQRNSSIADIFEVKSEVQRHGSRPMSAGTTGYSRVIVNNYTKL